MQRMFLVTGGCTDHKLSWSDAEREGTNASLKDPSVFGSLKLASTGNLKEEDKMGELKSDMGTRSGQWVLDGVDRYQVIEPMFEGIRVILSHRGEKYSAAYIQGISGAAFRIAGICPCAPTCSSAMQPHELIQLLGYEAEVLPLSGEGIDPEERIHDVVKRVKEEVRSGRPVLVWHAFTNAEWDVVCGFDDGTRQFFGRGSYAGADDYAEADEARMATCGDICDPVGVVVIGEKTGTFDARKAELAALREAIEHAHSSEEPDEDKWVLLNGLMAYDRWISDFRDPEKTRSSGDSYCYGIYRSTHRAAAEFLEEIAPNYPEATERLRSAAAHFRSEAGILDSGADLLWWNSPHGPDADRNAKVADLLSKARESYAHGIQEIEKALAAIDASTHGSREKSRTPSTPETQQTVKIEGLEFVSRATSHMGALEGCLKQLGIEVSPGWLYGSTGQSPCRKR